jgi:hypothetical protein
MKYVKTNSFADPDAAARKLVEIANGVEAVQDGRIFIERVNEPFLAAGGSGEQFRAGIERASALGWLLRHESGTYVRFTDSGAALFALDADIEQTAALDACVVSAKQGLATRAAVPDCRASVPHRERASWGRPAGSTVQVKSRFLRFLDLDNS